MCVSTVHTSRHICKRLEEIGEWNNGTVKPNLHGQFNRLIHYVFPGMVHLWPDRVYVRSV